ncbi:MAG: SGNH/GDSL hydrolase family protein [Verrucomicrobiota bacterium]
MKTIFTLLAALAISAAAEPIQPGDRIAIVGNTFADQLRVHGYLESMLLHHARENPVSIRNLGWGGDMLTSRDRPTGFPTEESTLTAHKTDVIIACFGMGESFAGINGVADFEKDLNDFIDSHKGKKYNGKSEVRLVLVSTIAYENLGSLTPLHEKRNRELGAYSSAIRNVAENAGIPFVNVYDETKYLMSEWKDGDFTTNGIHLNETGYWAVSRMMFEQLVDEPQFAWRVRLDAKGGLTFEVADEFAPSLPPPTDAPLPPQLQDQRDMVTVENLKPGSYALTIDDQQVATATHEEWVKGVVIDASPAHQDAEKYRAIVKDKNQQFIYSWKALNQVHIVGERRKSPAGQALPAEVIEFNKLAEQRDRQLQDGLPLKTRVWKLTPQ